jgi:hypothetical protein
MHVSSTCLCVVVCVSRSYGSAVAEQRTSVTSTVGSDSNFSGTSTHTFTVACVTKLVAALQSEKPGAPSQGVGLGRGGGGGQPISAGNYRLPNGLQLQFLMQYQLH